MKTWPRQYAIAYDLPPGVDADVHLYFVSPSTDVACRVTIEGATEFTFPERVLQEADKIMGSPEFREKAHDWRLMTQEEAKEYRASLKQEASNAHHDHQEG